MFNIENVMIVKILKSSGSFPAIQYNEEKIRQGVAERVELRNFGYLQGNAELLSADAIENYLVQYSETSSNHLKYPQFHVAFSAKGNSMTKEQLLDFADRWLEKMGYAGNPMVIYFHHDTDNNHLHVVTSRVGGNGKKINHNHERRRSQQTINEILGINPVNESKTIVDKALEYSYQSIGQFRSILESSSYETYEEQDHLNVKKGGGVLLQVPLALIKQGFTVDDSDERKKRAAQIKAWLLRYKMMCYNKEELQKLLHSKFGVDLVFHGKGVGGKEFTPYGYTIVDHRTKKVFKGSDVLPLKQLLEFIPYSREEKEREIQAFIDDAIQRDNMITTLEINKLLKKQTNAYISKGQVILNGVKMPLKDNLARILRINDKIAWVQSFHPRSLDEKNALAALFKIEPEYLKIKRSYEVDMSIIDKIRLIASLSDFSTFRNHLSQEGFRLFKHENEYFILSFNQNVILTAKECGVGEGLLEPPHRQEDAKDGISLGEVIENIGENLSDLIPEHPMESALSAADEALSMGGTDSGISTGGGAKDLSKKKKKRPDEREGGGRRY